MKFIGYARVSTSDQSLDIQRAELLAARCDPIYEEKASGSNMEGRQALQDAIAYLRKGDVLVVTRLDRLGRSTLDVCQTMQTLKNIGVGFRCLQQPIDTTTPFGDAMMKLLAVMAEFEQTIRKERQLEGIARAKANGVYKGGRKSIIDPEFIRQARDIDGLGAYKIAKLLNCSPKTIYRLVPDGWGECPFPSRRASHKPPSAGLPVWVD